MKRLKIDLKRAAQIIKDSDNVGILTHRNPDGDCLGGAYALCLVLRKAGKHARVLCSDKIGDKFAEYFAKYDVDNGFEIKTYISVDVATAELLGSYSELAEKVTLCIDHHPTNSFYAQNTLVDESAAAACEIVYMIADELGIDIDDDIATALYIGVMTDTGCFQYSNTTPRTHRIAALLMERDVPAAAINREFMALKSRGRLKLESLAIKGLRYYHDGAIAIMPITERMQSAAHVTDEELDGVAPIPCQIEGVEIGVTVRQKEENKWRVSLRSVKLADVSAVAAKFGGGGHKRAAGCTVEGGLDEVISMLAEACEAEIRRIEQ